MTAIPSFIYRKSNQLIQIAFVPIFALLFILVYKPLDFGSLNVDFLSRWGWPERLISETITVAMILVGTAIVAVSRIIMNSYTKRHQISYVSYIAWVATEIVVMSIIYTIASFLADPSDGIGELFKRSLYKTIAILMIPYVMTYVFFIWQEKSRQLKSLKKQLEENEDALKNAYIQIMDERGELRLSLRRENLLFIESEDNYVCVWYLGGNAVKNIMVRNTLKKVAEQLEGKKIKRCHRSYMINIDHIKALRREKEGFFIEMGIDGVPDIPISKTYGQEITSQLMS